MEEPKIAESTLSILTRAALGPNILNSLPPKIAAIIPPQNPVMIPATGFEPEAIGKEIH